MSEDVVTPIEGPTLEGSKDARRQAVLVLELLTGLRSPAETSEALGCSLSRVYQLEARALQGVVVAMEPRPRGRPLDLERKVAEIERQKEALADELARTQALVRAAYRSFGVPASVVAPKRDARPAGKRRRKATRARKAIARIAAGGGTAADGAASTPTSASKPPRSARTAKSPPTKSKPA